MGVQPALFDAQIQKVEDEQIRRIRETTEAARVAIDEISVIVTYADYKIALTLRAADLTKPADARKDQNADEQAARLSRRDEFLARIQQIVTVAMANIVHLVEQSSPNGKKPE